MWYNQTAVMTFFVRNLFLGLKQKCGLNPYFELENGNSKTGEGETLFKEGYQASKLSFRQFIM